MSNLCPVAVSQGSADMEDQPETASQSQLLFLKQKKYCDVIFTFPNLPDRIAAHEFCLKARSPVFEQIFRLRKSGNVQGSETEISDSTPQRFQEFLEFIYSDKLEVDMAGALDLLHLAHKYKIRPLIKKCEELLKADIPVEDSVKVFETARHYGSQEMMGRAGDIMVKSFADLKIGSFTDAKEETLLFLLEHDDLDVDEIKLFEIVLEWGRIQVGPCADEQHLKNKLKNVISKIRFTNMAPYEFTKTVMPTGLLSAEDSLSVFSYFGGDEMMRKEMKINFNTNLRKVGKMEKFLDFYLHQKYECAQSVTFSKEIISFTAERSEVVTRRWSGYFLRQPVINGIRIAVRYREHGFSFKFNVSIRQYSSTTDEESFTIKFQTTLLNPDGMEHHAEDVPVEPPVELISASVYSVILISQLQTSMAVSKIAVLHMKESDIYKYHQGYVYRWETPA